MAAARSTAVGIALAGVMVMLVTPSAGGEAAAPVSSTATPAIKQRIVFTSDRDGNDEIYRMSVDGSRQVRLTDNVWGDREPAFSASGKWVVFTSDRDGNDEIYRMRADGSRQVRLTDNVWGDREPAFSPSGKWVAFTSDRDGHDEIYRMRADGSRQVRLTDSHASSAPAFSPNGKTIAYQYWRARAGDWEVYRMDADGSDPANLTRERDAYDAEPAFAPDGRTIVFVSNRDDGFESADLYRMRADGSGQALIRGDLVNEGWPTFSSDGRFLVYAADLESPAAGAAWEIFRLKSSAEGADLPVQLTSGDGDDTSPSWGGRSASRLTVTARADSAAVSVRGLLEPATVGNEVNVTLSRKRDGTWTRVKSITASVRGLRDRDADGRADGRYRARLERSCRGPCRVKVAFDGDYLTRASSSTTRTWS